MCESCKLVGISPCGLGIGVGVHYCVSVKLVDDSPCGLG